MITIPTWIKPFDKIFEQLCYRWDCSQIFDDFLDIAINCFHETPSEELTARIAKRYSEEEQQLFSSLFSQWLQSTLKELNSDEWIYTDLLGEYYEYISGKYKKSNFGQFFTPQPIADMMTRMIICDATPKMQRINDPACGSGRMMLSAHMYLKGNMIAFAEDLDKICCKMTVLNFIIHGVEGEVVHHNSLDLNHYLQGWYVNRHRRSGVFTVCTLPKEKSHIMSTADEVVKTKSTYQKEEDSKPEQLIINF